MKRVIQTALMLAMMSATIYAQQPAVKPEPRKQAPSAEEQLVIVRLRAQLLDAELRRKQAMADYEQADKEIRTARPQLDGYLESLKSKLPKPAEGKTWAIQSDGQQGAVFVEVDLEKGQSAEGKGQEAARKEPANVPKKP